MPRYLTKRYLVTENQYRSLSDRSDKSSKTHTTRINHPNLDKAKRLKEKMDEDNHNPSMSDFDKVLNYTSNLANYLQNVTKSLTLPKAKAILGKRTKPTKEKIQRDEAPILEEPRVETPEVQQMFFETPEATPAVTATRNSSMPPRRLATANQESRFYTPRLSSTPVVRLTRMETAPPYRAQTPEIPVVTRPKRSRAQRFSREALFSSFNDQEREVVGAQLDKLMTSGRFDWNPNTGKIALDKKTLPRGDITSLVEDLRGDKRNFSVGKDFDRVYSLLDGNSPPRKEQSKKPRRQ
jgi:hypothetical protein